jgi:hypothetical protein
MSTGTITVAVLGTALLLCPRTFAQTQQPTPENAPQNKEEPQDQPTQQPTQQSVQPPAPESVQQNAPNNDATAGPAKVAFPAEEQITAVLDQGDKAAQEYEAAINSAEERGSGSDKTFAKDRKAISDWKALSDSLRAGPSQAEGAHADSAKYDGESGFNVVVTLNEASRTASLAALELLTQATIFTREWNFSAVESRRRTAHAFQRAAGQLQASSEGATQLFHSYLAAKDALTRHMAETLNRAAEALTVCKAAASK